MAMEPDKGAKVGTRTDRDEKLKLARERQNEERQRKIEELKAQAEAAQRYREQKEEERRRRIEEIRNRDTEKRQQVEQRKRAIMEAEKERREYILRKNQERESRLGSQRRERNSISFAFGSSTPRLLEPADFGMVSPSTFWGHRRSTSISNVAGASLSRRSSERELTDSGGAKKRATSASGTDRHDVDRRKSSSSMYEVFNWGCASYDEPPKRYSLAIVGSEINFGEPPPTATTVAQASNNYNSNNNITTTSHRPPTYTINTNITGKEDNIDGSQIVFRSVARRKTDLMPTIPSPRDHHHYGSKSSLSTTPRTTPGSRSGNVTPGGSTRPSSALSTSTTLSTSGYVARRSMPSARKPRPASIAGTGLSLDEINKLKRDTHKSKPPMKASNNNSNNNTPIQTTPKRTMGMSMMSTSMYVTSSGTRLTTSASSSTEKRTPNKRDLGLHKATSTPKSSPLSKTSSHDSLNKLRSNGKEQPKESLSTAQHTASIVASKDVESAESVAAVPLSDQTKVPNNALNSEKTDELVDAPVSFEPEDVSQCSKGDTIPPAEPVPNNNNRNISNSGKNNEEEKTDVGIEKEVGELRQSTRNGSKEKSEMRELTPPQATDVADLMTASMIARSKINTEEEAKAALAERRRLARVEAERQADLERQRVEAERLAETRRQEEEAEAQRLFEEESTRLAAEQRHAEEERLRQAIEEVKQREVDEQRKREEDERQRIEREEAEKKAKEDAEKQRIEVAERLKREEKEREERRKRVEAIMSRTRKTGPATNTPVKGTPDDSATTPAETLVQSESDTQHPQQGAATPQQQQHQRQQQLNSNASDSIASANTAAVAQLNTEQQQHNTQVMYEQAVIDKETSIINSFSNMIIDENAKNLQQQPQQSQQILDIFNGKLHPTTDTATTTLRTTIANGNGHHRIENINKNAISILQDTRTPAVSTMHGTDQLIDFGIETQQQFQLQDNINNGIIFNNNNNNMMATTTTIATPLVTADSHENKDISLL